MEEGNPVISVDAKKKELVGPYKNTGQTWEPKGAPVEVNDHDFPDKDLGRVTPYGVYDVQKNEGWVNVGTDHDTASFAVESIRRWWTLMGRKSYPDAKELVITADGGGSNASRSRLFKVEIQALANELGLPVRVSHFPPGTSKWNKIEHRLFSQISMNWKGQPLTSHEVIGQPHRQHPDPKGPDRQGGARRKPVSSGSESSRQPNERPQSPKELVSRRVELCRFSGIETVKQLQLLFNKP